MRLDTIIQRPMITERSLARVKSSVYGFYVNPKAGKKQISAALEKLFGVKVSSVRTLTRKGKVRKAGRRMVKKQLPDRKVAYVHVSQGKIDLFPQT